MPFRIKRLQPSAMAQASGSVWLKAQGVTTTTAQENLFASSTVLSFPSMAWRNSRRSAYRRMKQRFNHLPESLNDLVQRVLTEIEIEPPKNCGRGISLELDGDDHAQKLIQVGIG